MFRPTSAAGFIGIAAVLWSGPHAFAQGSPNCSTATVISGTGTFNFDNRNAPEGSGDANACWMERTVWFRWTAPQTGVAVFSTCGLTDMDSAIAVYPGTCGSAKIACNNDAGCGIGSTVTWNATANTQYLLRIGQPDGYWSGWYGQFTLGYDNPPQNNDSCQYATPVTTPGLYSYDTRSATSSPTDPPSCDLMGKDVWFSYTAPETGTAGFSTCGLAPFDGMRMAAYTGANPCNSSTPYIDCVSYDIYCPQGAVSLLFNVTAGQTYKVRIGSARGQTSGFGQFEFDFSPEITNDECETASEITGTGWFAYGNATATDSQVADDPSNYCGKDVWFRWTSPVTGVAYATTCGRIDIQPFMAVYPDGCPVVDSISANDDDPACGTASRVDWRVVQGEAYLIRIGSVWGDTYTTDGQFEIQAAELPGTGGETITVTITGDYVDFWGFRTVADLPGPDGEVSFREATLAANNTPNGQTIGFACDPRFWTYPNSNYAEIVVDFDPFIITDDDTDIDGFTQTAAFGDTNPSGPDVGFFGLQAWNVPAIIFHASNCDIQGINDAYLCGSALEFDGSNNRVVDCIFTGALVNNIEIFGGANNVIGEPGHGNRLAGFNEALLITDGATGTKVQGNVISGSYAGVRVLGGATNTTIGGPALAARNVVRSVGRYVGEGSPTGTYIQIGSSTNTLVQNNTVGLAEDGRTRATGAGTTGISIADAVQVQVLDNTVAGIFVQGVNHYANQFYGVGINVTGVSNNLTFQGNIIGSDTQLAAAIPCREGFKTFLPFSHRATFGGTAEGQGNTVAYSNLTGVTIGGAPSVVISGNSIFENGLLGVDLLNGSISGVTPNDPGDNDAGANGLQNFPVLTSAQASGSAVRIAGTLNSRRSRQYRIEFFANPACDSNGHGEGERFLGATVVTTDGSGNAAFDATLNGAVTPGEFITATGTDIAAGETSEFSACLESTAGTSSRGDMNCDGSLNPFDIQGFTIAMESQFNYEQQYPECDWMNADANLDGSVNAFDIQAFVDLLAP